MSSKVHLISSDEESGEEAEVLIREDEAARDPEPEGPRNGTYEPATTRRIFVSIRDDYEYEWWVKLVAPIPQNQQCQIKNCKVAPPGHKAHPHPGRNFTRFEKKLIIQYLVHFDGISRGKGLKVYEEMHSFGYMQHRSVQTLNNNFKRILLRDLDLFELPDDIKAQFVALRP